MLSKIDIENELGIGIYIFPLIKENIRENSINFSIGDYAWIVHSNWSGSVNNHNVNFREGESTITKIDDQDVVVLPPHKTVIVATEEVIALDSRIGGLFCSKVGTIAKGVCHISTMIGPDYRGHLMIPLQNCTDDPIILKKGETFVSLTLFYLNEKKEGNDTDPAQVDKWAEWGLKITDEERANILESWKKNTDEIRRKMKQDPGFIELENQKEEKKKKRLKGFGKYITMRNVVAVICFIIVSALLLFLYNRQIINKENVALASIIYIPLYTFIFRLIEL